MFTPCLNSCLHIAWRLVYKISEGIFTEYQKTYLLHGRRYFNTMFENTFTHCMKQLHLHNAWRHVSIIFENTLTQCMNALYMFLKIPLYHVWRLVILCMKACLHNVSNIFTLCVKACSYSVERHVYTKLINVSQNSNWHKMVSIVEKGW